MGHLWSPKLIFDAKSEPTAPPKCPQGPKHASKMIPKGPKMILKVTLKVYSLGTLTLDRRFEQRPGGLREALTINSLDPQNPNYPLPNYPLLPLPNSFYM